MEPREATEKAPLKPDDGRLLRGRRSRARIREAARTLFHERGFDRATLREIAARAGMGASSIYRHVRSKEELLVTELAQHQEKAWQQFRRDMPQPENTRQRVQRFLDIQHELLSADADWSRIALRATTHGEGRAARHVLALHDRGIGLLAEILQNGRMRGDLRREVDVLEAARAIFHIALGARIPWANGLIPSETCRRSIATAVDLLFHGLRAENTPPTEAQA